MTNKIGGLRTAIYQVSNIEAAKKWYTEAFATAPYFDEPFYVGFNIGGYELGLQPNEDIVTGKSESVAAYWAAEEVKATYDWLIGLGATPHEAPQEVGGGIIVATVKDPWNNVIGLIFNPHFGPAQ